MSNLKKEKKGGKINYSNKKEKLQDKDWSEMSKHVMGQCLDQQKRLGQGRRIQKRRKKNTCFEHCAQEGAAINITLANIDIYY